MKYFENFFSWLCQMDSKIHGGQKKCSCDQCPKVAQLESELRKEKADLLYAESLIRRLLAKYEPDESTNNGTQNRTEPKNEGTASEAAHSLAAECGESALLPKRPGFAAAELPEHEYGSLHVGVPHSTFHETEDERKNRLSDQRIALARSRLIPGI